MRTAFAALFSFLAVGLFSQELPANLQIKVDLVYLASDFLEGRETGSRGEALAAEYIAARFAEMDIEGGGTDGSYFQDFDFVYKPNPHAEDGINKKGRNVIGYIDNGADYTVVVGAHYDHLGYGQFNSLYTGKPAIHNGADDNASGVAGLLYLAGRLKKMENPTYNFLLIGFSGEELGLVGSKYYVNNPGVSLDKMAFMLNMDMMGRLNKDQVLIINGVGTSPAWERALSGANTQGFKLKTTVSGVGGSDHTAFYLKEVPAIHFFTGQHKSYHKPIDDVEEINFQGIRMISDYCYNLITGLAPMGKLAFQKTKDQGQRTGGGFKVTLGVMPDYVYQGKGMRADAVVEGRVGHKAGMKDGDVVIKIGEHDIKDIYVYMEALGKFSKGDTVKLVVKRDDKEVELEATFE